MKQFYKLNAMSMLYALMIFVPVELMVNVCMGLLIIGAMIIFPIYIAVIHFVGSNLISGSRLMNKIRGES